MATVKGYTVKNQWINFSLYFVNFMYKTKRNPNRSKVCPWIIPQKSRLKSNSEPIGGGQRDTQFLGDGNTYQTDFIEINKDDFVNVFYPEIYNLNNISYLQLGLKITIDKLKGIYKRNNTGPNTNQETNSNDPTQYYFLKGVFNNNIIQFLINSKIV